MKELPNTDDFSLRFRDNAVVQKLPGSLAGRPFVLEELSSCEVSLLDNTDQLTISGCKDTTIRCGPTRGLCTISQCSDCVIAVAATKCVVSASEGLILFVYSAEEPEVRNCHQISLAPYNLAYPKLKEHFRAAQLEPRKNAWSRVRCDQKGGYGTCWVLMRKEDFYLDIQELEDYGSVEDPVPRPDLYGGVVLGEIQIGSIEEEGEEDAEEPVIIYESDWKSSQPAAGRFSPVKSPDLRVADPLPANSFAPANLPGDAVPSVAAQGSEATSDHIVVFCDEENGFAHAMEHPRLTVVATFLEELTGLVAPHYQSRALLQASAYLLGLGSLLLYLFIVLLEDFVEMHPAALAILFILLTAAWVGLAVVIFLKWRTLVRACDTELSTYTTARQSEFSAVHLDVRATMGQVTVKPLTGEAVRQVI